MIARRGMWARPRTTTVWCRVAQGGDRVQTMCGTAWAPAATDVVTRDPSPEDRCSCCRMLEAV